MLRRTLLLTTHTLIVQQWFARCQRYTELVKGTRDPEEEEALRDWPRHKYYYAELESGSVNHCMGFSHQLHGMACALAEAAHLGRTLILSDQFCMSHFHNPTGENVWRPMTDVFNISVLQQQGPIKLVANPEQFIQELTPSHAVLYLRDETSTTRLEQLDDIEVLVRMHRQWEQDPLKVWGYRPWWTPCMLNGDIMKRMEDQKGFWVPPDSTKHVAEAVMHKLGGKGNYCALHVRRGDKLHLEGLDEATRPAGILANIRDRCPPGSTLYLASNEKDPHFFDDLKAHYELYSYRDFIEDLMPLGSFKWDEEKKSYFVHDNLLLYQAEVLIIEAAEPWMETFCILYHGPHQGCDQEWQGTKNARVYNVEGYNGLVG